MIHVYSNAIKQLSILPAEGAHISLQGSSVFKNSVTWAKSGVYEMGFPQWSPGQSFGGV